MKNIIFQNTKEQIALRERYASYAEILNENAQKIIKCNDNLNNKEFIIYTLSYNKNHKKILDVLESIMKTINPFITKDIVIGFNNEIKYKLLYNGYNIRKGFLNEIDYTKGHMNIKQIMHISDEEITNIIKVLDYNEDAHVFTINDEEIKRLQEKYIYYVKNKKQTEIINKIEELNRIFKQLDNLGIDIYYYLNNDNETTKIIMNDDLAKDIQIIE